MCSISASDSWPTAFHLSELANKVVQLTSMLAAAPQSPEDVPSRHLVGVDSLFKVCKLPPGKDLKVAEPFLNFQHPQELTRCRWILCSQGRNEGRKNSKKKRKEGRKNRRKNGRKEGMKEGSTRKIGK